MSGDVGQCSRGSQALHFDYYSGAKKTSVPLNEACMRRPRHYLLCGQRAESDACECLAFALSAQPRTKKTKCIKPRFHKDFYAITNYATTTHQTLVMPAHRVAIPLPRHAAAAESPPKKIFGKSTRASAPIGGFRRESRESPQLIRAENPSRRSFQGSANRANRNFGRPETPTRGTRIARGTLA